jgi:hypothetical protein
MINQVSINTKTGLNDFFRFARTDLARMQETDDILKIGKNLCVKDWGFKSYFTAGLVGNTMSKEGSMTCITGSNSFIFGSTENLDIEEPNNVLLYNDELPNKVEELPLKVGFVFYEEGWVLGNGKTNCNIFNIMGSKSYIASIGSRNIRTSSISGAKIFKTKKSMLDFLTKHREALEYCVETYGYHISMQPTNSYFETSYQETLKGKSLEKDIAISNEINELIDAINQSAISDGYDESHLPSEATIETMQAEVIYRMKKLNLWDVIIDEYRKSGKVYMSEYGIIYELDDAAKKVVNEVLDKGYIPYHVVHTSTTIGEMYNVLYVSDDISNWKYERGNVDGYLYNVTYNVTIDDCEYGENCFIGGTGGLTRTT